MAEPVAWRQAIDQREDIGGDVLRKLAVVEPQRVLHILAQGEDLRRRGRLVNGHGKSGDNRPRLPARQVSPLRTGQGWARGRPSRLRGWAMAWSVAISSSPRFSVEELWLRLA